MEKKKHFIMNGIIALLLMLFVFVTIKFFPVYKIIFIVIGKLLLPFIVAAFVSYLIYPIYEKLLQYRIHPMISILVIFLIFMGGTVFICYKSIPVFVHEVEELSKQLPSLLKQYEGIIYQMYDSTSFLPEIVHDKMDTLIGHVETLINGKVNGLLTKVFQLPGFFVFLAIIPVLVFYFLKDFASIKYWVKSWIPHKYHFQFDKILKAIDNSLGGYVRGQFTISAVIIAATYTVYHVIDLKYAFILAIFMGVMNIIPYFGPIIGTIPAAFIAITTSVKLFIIVIITNMIIQILESSFLSPYVMGKHVHIHPVILIFTLLAGAEFGGIIGMVIAIPTVTILRAVYKQLKDHQMQSY